MNGVDIDESDFRHLEPLERGAFAPIGQLYQGVFGRLAERGLCYDFGGNGYQLSTYGLEQVTKFRLRLTSKERR